MISIPIGLRYLLIAVSLLVFAVMIYSSIKASMEVRYAIIWITWAAILLIIALFPGLALILARAIGIQSVTNFLFLVMSALLFIFNYYLYLRMSKQNKQIRDLNYELALLKKKVDEMK